MTLGLSHQFTLELRNPHDIQAEFEAILECTLPLEIEPEAGKLKLNAGAGKDLFHRHRPNA